MSHRSNRTLLPRRQWVLLSAGLLAGCGADSKETKETEETDPEPSTDYFPPNDSDEWEAADPEATGWSPQGLTDLVALVKENNSSSFMMLSGGQVLVEEYFLNATRTTELDVASVQKSFTSTLLGLARDKQLLSFDDTVSSHLAEGWSNATPQQEAAITLRHLMTHASGLNPNTLNYATTPGTLFDYNTNAYQKLRLVLEQVAGTDINELSREWLFNAIGIGGQWGGRTRRAQHFGDWSSRRGTWRASGFLRSGPAYGATRQSQQKDGSTRPGVPPPSKPITAYCGGSKDWEVLERKALRPTSLPLWGRGTKRSSSRPAWTWW